MFVHKAALSIQISLVGFRFSQRLKCFARFHDVAGAAAAYCAHTTRISVVVLHDVHAFDVALPLALCTFYGFCTFYYDLQHCLVVLVAKCRQNVCYAINNLI